MQVAILYVDDDKDDREIFCEVLREVYPHVQCYLADGANAAFRILNSLQSPPLCIFMDVNMPMMTGIDLLTELQKDTNYARIPMYMLSTSTRHAEVAKSLGAKGYLVKPNTYSELFQLLKAFPL